MKVPRGWPLFEYCILILALALLVGVAVRLVMQP